MHNGRGKFITFEGGEGSGKTTQVHRLAKRLRADGRQVVTTREPGGTPFAEDVRELIMRHGQLSTETEVLLFTAARRDHVERTIKPSLDLGWTVLCDRFVHSTIAYQSMPYRLIKGLHDEWCGVLPDRTFLLDVEPEIGLKRRHQAGESNRFDDKTIEFHRNIRERYLAMEGLIRIDASQDADAVEEEIARWM